jgi:hypothetical protein
MSPAIAVRNAGYWRGSEMQSNTVRPVSRQQSFPIVGKWLIVLGAVLFVIANV